MKNEAQQGRFVIHYTCNSPPHHVLKKNGLESLGDKYQTQPREHIKIPEELLKKKGLFSEDPIILYINCEKLMRDLK
ncbi:MAG: hypothetical protein QXP53_00790 [Candidatus Pacearchaeota archaeon]